MLIKIVIVVMLFIAIASLGSALLFLLKDDGQSNRTVKALSIRIGVSMGIFILLMAAYFAGLIQPHGVTP